MYKTIESINDWHWVCALSKWLLLFSWIGLAIVIGGTSYLETASTKEALNVATATVICIGAAQIPLIFLRLYGVDKVKKLWTHYIEETINGRFALYNITTLPIVRDESMILDQFLSLLQRKHVHVVFHTELHDTGTFHVPFMDPSDPLTRILYTYSYPLGLSRDALEETVVKRLRKTIRLGGFMAPGLIIHPKNVLFPPLERF